MTERLKELKFKTIGSIEIAEEEHGIDLFTIKHMLRYDFDELIEESEKTGKGV